MFAGIFSYAGECCALYFTASTYEKYKESAHVHARYRCSN
jgi:hypothetical protein